MKRRGFTLIELLVVIGIIAILTAVLLAALSRARESGRRASCASNLKQFGLSLKMYANEAGDHKFPPNTYAYGDDTGPGVRLEFDFFFQGNTMYPEYLNDPNVLFCPSDPDAASDMVAGVFNCKKDKMQICPCRFGRRSYIYLSWATTSDLFVRQGVNSNDPNFRYTDIDPTAMLVFNDLHLTYRPTLAGSIAKIDRDISFGDYTPGNPLIMYRLREGVERFLITDINNPATFAEARSAIPVMFDELATKLREGGTRMNHVPGGCNVLYMDGHVSFVKYRDWPVTTAMTVFMGYFNPLFERLLLSGG